MLIACSPFSSRLGLALTLALSAVPASSQGSVELEDQDWADLRAAHVSKLHEAQADGDGFHSYNPAQRWDNRFDGRGLTVAPAGADWTWGLELVSFGFGAQQQLVGQPQQIDAQAATVRYRWDATLDEWYINDARGVEHGFTLHQEPPHDTHSDEDALVFKLAVRGELQAQLTEGRRAVHFLRQDGSLALTYSGLHAFDADGKPLASNFALDAEHFLIEVDVRDARYPITVDPVAQQAYFKASNTEFADRFGSKVAVSGDTIAIAALREDSSASGVNGSQGNGRTDSGAVYIFVKTPAGWVQEAYLKASNPGLKEEFGRSLAISGDTVVVGTFLEKSNATGVNGAQGNNSLDNAGAAYVFVRTAGVWSQQAYLKPSTMEANDRFAWELDISGDTIVVSALGESSNATGVNGDQSDNSEPGAGAVYVFSRTGTTWSQSAYLKASNAEAGDSFGVSVSISGDTIAVGASGEDSPAAGVDADQGNDPLYGAYGAAYVFVRNAGTWTQEAYIKPSVVGQDGFGAAVSVSGDTLAVGAPSDNSNATGVNGNQFDNSLNRAGAAYAFHRNGSTWTEEAYLKPSNTSALKDFGSRLAASDNMVVVGVEREDSSGVGVDGTDRGLTSDSIESGSAFVYTRNAGNWSQFAYLKASNAFKNSDFGFSVAISGDAVLIGAALENSDSTGVNGDQFPHGANGSGSAYLFDLGDMSPTGNAYCFGDGSGTVCPCGAGDVGAGCSSSVGGGAVLAGFGAPLFVLDSFGLTVTNLPPNKLGLCIKGSQRIGGGTGNPAGEGLLCTGAQLRSQIIAADAAGNVTMPDWRGQPFSMFQGAANTGGPTFYQWWYRDPQNACNGGGFNFTNGWGVDWL